MKHFGPGQLRDQADPTLDLSSSNSGGNSVSRRAATIGYLLLTLLATAGPTHSQSKPDLVIRGGWIFDGLGDTVARNTGILIRGGKIIEIGMKPNELDLAAAQVRELGEDDYIIPGMFDIHAHYAVDFFGRGRIDETRSYPIIFLANGVTSTFPAGEVDPEKMRDLRMQIDAGERIGPRILNSGPYFGPARYGWNPEASTADIEAEVDYWAAQGVRGLKAKRITREHLGALIERAHQHGLTVTGHLDSGFRDTVNPRDAILMGIDRIEHFLGGDAISDSAPAYSSLEDLTPENPAVDAIIALYLRHGVFFDATLTAYGYFGERDPEVFTYFADEQRYLTPYMRELLQEREPRPVMQQFEKIYWVKRRTLKAFYDAGGAHLITLGTDHPSWGEYLSGFSVHRELHAMVLAGISPADALKAATINAARALNVASFLGTIEPGKFADLAIVSGNPLDDIRNTRNVQLVVKAGRIFDSRELLRSVEGTIGPAGPDEISEWVRWPESVGGGQ